MRLPVGPAADFSSLLHINHFVFATKNQRLIFIRNRKLNVLFKIEEKKENLSENYGLDMNRDLGKEIEDMAADFSSLLLINHSTVRMKNERRRTCPKQ